MATNKLALLTCLVACVLMAQMPACAAKHAHAGLKPLTPEMDESILPDPSELFDQAVKEYGAGHMAKAEKLFSEVIKYDPRNADAHFNLGAIREWQNNLQSALAEYRAAAAIKPQDPEIADAVRSVQYKIAHKSELDAQAAKLKLEQQLSMDGQAAKQAFSSQNYVEAIMHLTRLSAAMPEDAKVQFALGQSLRALKYYEWAAYRLKLAIFLDPENDLYRKTLVELDQEIDDAQQQAYSESAQMALTKMGKLSFPELADTGIGPHAF